MESCLPCGGGEEALTAAISFIKRYCGKREIEKEEEL